jgi:AcrR family transcriptional regulator
MTAKSASAIPAIRHRAKSPEQKALRRQQILDAAAAHFAGAAFDKVNLIDIAQHIGITKAALYRYFRSKETLFLALYLQQLEVMVASAEVLDTQQTPAEACVEVINQNPLFCRLNAILHTVLEQNLTVAEAIDFKRELMPLMARFAQKISDWLGVSIPQAIGLLHHIQATMIGCWHIAHPSETAAEAMKQTPFDHLLVDFKTVFHQHIHWLMAGFIEVQGDQSQSREATHD